MTTFSATKGLVIEHLQILGIIGAFTRAQKMSILSHFKQVDYSLPNNLGLSI
jgi:hypothetical protein